MIFTDNRNGTAMSLNLELTALVGLAALGSICRSEFPRIRITGLDCHIWFLTWVLGTGTRIHHLYAVSTLLTEPYSSLLYPMMKWKVSVEVRK